MNKQLYLITMLCFTGCAGVPAEKKQKARTPEEAFSIYQKAILGNDLPLYHSITEYDLRNVENIDFEFRLCRLRMRNRALYEKKYSTSWVAYFFEINGKGKNLGRKIGTYIKGISPSKESKDCKMEKRKGGRFVWFGEDSRGGFKSLT